MGKIKDKVIEAMENEDMTYDEAVDHVNSIFKMRSTDRQKSNREILEILRGLIEAHPDQRFVQLLANADIIEAEQSSDGFSIVGYKDFYHMESKETLERVKKSPILNLKEEK